MIDIAKWAKYAEEHFSISDESIEYSMEHTMQQMLTWQRYDPDEKRTHPPKQGEYLVLINGEIVINAMFEKGTYQSYWVTPECLDLEWAYISHWLEMLPLPSRTT
jgi:hypothetical protein